MWSWWECVKSTIATLLPAAPASTCSGSATASIRALCRVALSIRMKALLEIGPKGPSLRMMSESLSACVGGVAIVGLLCGPACAAGGPACGGVYSTTGWASSRGAWTGATSRP